MSETNELSIYRWIIRFISEWSEIWVIGSSFSRAIENYWCSEIVTETFDILARKLETLHNWSQFEVIFCSIKSMWIFFRSIINEYGHFGIVYWECNSANYWTEELKENFSKFRNITALLVLRLRTVLVLIPSSFSSINVNFLLLGWNF